MLNNSLNKLNLFNYNSTNTCLPSIVQPSLKCKKSNPFIAKGDSGTTNHYSQSDHKKILRHVQPITYRPSVILPNVDIMKATLLGIAHLHPDLSPVAPKAHILPYLETLLLSLGQLVDNGCVILLEKLNCVCSKFLNFY